MTPAGAQWLRGELLEIATALFPDHPPQVVREWADPVRWRDPAPIGHRFLVLLCLGGDGRPPASGFDDMLDVLERAGWAPRRWTPRGDGAARSATARREDFEVRVHQGGGRGILTVTGWAPTVYTGRQWGEPQFTISTAGGVLCNDCHGWGDCLTCEGRPYSGGTGGYGRCWCAGSSDPGLCIECTGTGLLTPEEATSMRRHRGLPDTDSGDTESHDSNTSAFVAVSERLCGCGEFRCFWRNTVAESDGHLLSRFTGTCHGCGAQRDHSFLLPLPGNTSA
ncbi:hypothetical protein [Streptomyces sp. NBC_01012]|uniref:hypothetical protein n=1 Tax=Streptomyces sp. NBC_01012 TaxID=2903717 RepID=UPI00386A3FB6|nr:hypothetical protein OG623_32530 [Streptomyces sp. NBC_01012]